MFRVWQVGADNLDSQLLICNCHHQRRALKIDQRKFVFDTKIEYIPSRPWIVLWLPKKNNNLAISSSRKLSSVYDNWVERQRETLPSLPSSSSCEKLLVLPCMSRRVAVDTQFAWHFQSPLNPFGAESGGAFIAVKRHFSAQSGFDCKLEPFRV